MNISVIDYTNIQFLTSGHVDDGKSTLIGRLLYDIGAVPEDHIAAATDEQGHIDFSLFTDGLEDERRQGITIDVAYRFFRYQGCRYRIADTPGHLQYMRNMAVAAVASDIAVILIDAIHGIRLQTVQYSKIARFFGVRQFVIAVNKMDAVDYSQKRFEDIVTAYQQSFSAEYLEGIDMIAIPVSALKGDNIVFQSKQTPWYQGKTVLEAINGFERFTHRNHDVRLPVQHVVKDQNGTRWYLGTLHGRHLEVGDKLSVADNRQQVTISALYYSGKPVSRVERRQAVAVAFAEDVDITRGSVLSLVSTPAPCRDEGNADILWLDKNYEDFLRFTGTMKLHHQEVMAELDITGDKEPLKTARFALATPVAMDSYAENPHAGLFILMDDYNAKVAAVGTISGF